jgi:hypothetical protein
MKYIVKTGTDLILFETDCFEITVLDFSEFLTTCLLGKYLNVFEFVSNNLQIKCQHVCKISYSNIRNFVLGLVLWEPETRMTLFVLKMYFWPQISSDFMWLDVIFVFPCHHIFSYDWNKCLRFAATYDVFQKDLYNFESLYTIIHSICTVL